jgi:hypothetical protein
LPDSLITLSPERGHTSCGLAPITDPEQCVFKLTSPAASAAAARHFGCASPSLLLGPELENQDTTAGAILGSHWEMRLFAGELMAPIVLFDEMFVSEVSLGFFEDSGWYAVNYGAATTTGRRGGVQWGVGQGCDFALQPCLRPAPASASASPSSATSSASTTLAGVVPAGSPAHFCATPGGAACTYDLRGKGSCVMVPFSSAAYPSLRLYMYFRDATSAADVLQAGFLSQADYCPLVVPMDACTAAAEQPPGGGAAGEVFGGASRCFMSTLRVSMGTNGSAAADVAAATSAAPACYATECAPDALSVRVSARGVDGVTRTLTCLQSQEGA